MSGRMQLIILALAFIGLAIWLHWVWIVIGVIFILAYAPFMLSGLISREEEQAKQK